MLEVFILLRPETGEDVRTLTESIESAGGRVLLSFAPFAVVAHLPSERLDELYSNPAIQMVATGEIIGDDLAAAPDTVRMAMHAWNEYLIRPHKPRERSSEGLSWDAPDRLPPDLPSDIREILRLREQDFHQE